MGFSPCLPCVSEGNLTSQFNFSTTERYSVRLINNSVYIFIALLIFVLLPSIFTTAWVIMLSVTLGSLLVVLQVYLVLSDEHQSDGDLMPPG